MSAPGTPSAGADIDVSLAGRLIEDQRPDLAGLPIVVLAEGWDNVSFRLGDEWVARLPKHDAGAELLAGEGAFLSEMATALPLRVPVPVHLGEPGHGYPWRWCIYTFVPGDDADRSPPVDPEATAETLARFLEALHQPDRGGAAPRNPFRGVSLSTRDEATRRRLGAIAARGIDTTPLAELWEAALAVPDYAGVPVWLHGDLHPRNLLVEDGRLVGVVDFGDITSGDPATDLSVAWMLVPLSLHGHFRDVYGRADDETWERARGWALSLGVAFMTPAHGDRSMEPTGRRALDRVLGDLA